MLACMYVYCNNWIFVNSVENILLFLKKEIHIVLKLNIEFYVKFALFFPPQVIFLTLCVYVDKPRTCK